MTYTPHSPDLRAFLINPGFLHTLKKSWSENLNAYLDVENDNLLSIDVLRSLQLYHVYQQLLGDTSLPHKQRAELLTRSIADRVEPNGVLREGDGSLIDHPAHGCHIADGLGTVCHYGPRLGYAADVLEQCRAALIRILDNHPALRPLDGTIGRSQQMRFEVRAYYWAWRVTGQDKYKELFFKLWDNGIHAYQNPMAWAGSLYQPSLHPDYTWNYTCNAGTTTEYATNTHTPVYYNAEPQGFVFTYIHGLKEKAFPPNPVWNEFCRKFIMGTLRNLSRAGHLSSDVDGYGIHRAWLSACLVEVAPYEGLGAADAIGLDPEMKSWFRWYIDQHVGFVQRLSTYEKSGLPVRMPYGQNITIEKQFCALLASRCYSYLARALYEYDDLAAMPAVEPPAHLGYAWWHNWLRVSTPAYETSFVGTTSLRHLPVVRHFGDPNLGCIHGGSPLSMLFVNNRLMYATSNDPAGLWHAEIIDVNGNLHRSCATSFADETAMAVKTSDGRLLSRDDFKAYEDPFYNTIHDKTPAEVIWSKNLRSQGFRFSIHNSYAPDTLHLNWGMHFPRGFYVESAAFLLAVPINMNPEVQFGDNNWVPLSSITQKDQWPTALRWSDGVAMVTTSLKPSSAQFAGKFRVIPLEPKLRAPGGENSFCPYPLYQLRLEVKMDTTLEAAALSADMSFHTESIK